MPQKTFTVFIGSQTEAPAILSDDSERQKYDESKIVDVPVEYLKSFQKDIEGSLRDLAGISIMR
jgi:hypothetical protein